MVRRVLRAIALPLALVLLLGAASAPAVLAKGRPMRVEITQATCGSFTADVSWWKKLDVHQIRVDAYFNDSFQQIQTRTSTALITSPQTITMSSLPFSGALTTYRADVFLYADTAQTPQQLLATASGSITFDCFA